MKEEEARNNRCLDAAAPATSSCEATSETSEIGTSSAKNSHFPCCIGTRFPVGLQAEQTPVVLLPRVVHSELEQLKTVENFFFTFLTYLRKCPNATVNHDSLLLILKLLLPRFLLYD